MSRSPIPRSIVAAFVVCSCMGCSDSKPREDRPSVSQRTRVENLQARVDKTYRLSETESIKIVVVPGFPFGERCVIYSNAQGNTMQCRDVPPSDQ